MKTRIILIIVIGCGVLLMSQSAPAHCIQWNELYEKVILLNKQGQTDQAIVVAHQTVITAENRFGSDHPYVAISLNVLAQLYSETKQYEFAESSFRRALEIYEKSLGLESLGVAQILTQMSGLYLNMNKIDEAFDCLSRAQSIYGKTCKTNPTESLK